MLIGPQASMREKLENNSSSVKRAPTAASEHVFRLIVALLKLESIRQDQLKGHSFVLSENTLTHASA